MSGPGNGDRSKARRELRGERIDSMTPHGDELRDRLQRLERLSQKRRRGAPVKASTLDDMDDVVGRDGVLILERDALSLMAPSAGAAFGERLARARDSLSKDGGADQELRDLLLAPEGALFLDTETTGLGSAMVFLLGVMRVTADRVVLRQVLARDYGEEPALLGQWTEMLRSAGMLVSFNGKSFDMPVLRDRLGLHGLTAPAEPPHVDLLHPARRRWRSTLPDCRLQTLEWMVCGRRRSGDIPGEEIPAAYHRFVRTGDPSDIMSVLHHNALDLLTLADIAAALVLPDDGLARP